MRRDHEGPIHRAILAYLRATLPHALIHHSPNESDMARADKARMRRAALGTRSGWPDLQVCLRYGATVYFEVKAEGSRVSPAQKAIGAALMDLGNHWAVVRSVDDVRACLAEWGIKTREVA